MVYDIISCARGEKPLEESDVIASLALLPLAQGQTDLSSNLILLTLLCDFGQVTKPFWAQFLNWKIRTILSASESSCEY